MKYIILLLLIMIVGVNAADVDAKTDELSLKTASDFHRVLLRSLKSTGLELVYEGPLGKTVEPNLQTTDDLDCWSICEKGQGRLKEVIVKFTLHPSRDRRSEGSCKINGATLFIVIEFVSKERIAKSKLEELAGKTFKAYLSEIKDLHFKKEED